MDFVGAVKHCFQNYGTFTGRAARSEFWFWVLFNLLLGVLLGFVDGMLFGPAEVGAKAFTPLSNLTNILLLVPSLAVTARRLHDTERSGWWMLIGLTIVGIIPLIIWYCTKGTDGQNRFGGDPLLGKIAA